MVNITSFAERNVGQRDKLEDFVLHGEIETGGGLNLHIILVADGAGGGEAGELAARLTGRTIQDYLEVSDETIIPKLLIEAVEEANRAVYNELQGEGTSTVALAAVNLDDESEFGRLYIAHVGDCHIGLMRDREFMRLNISHTIANEYFYAGQITADEAERLDNGSYPTRVIGVNPEIVVDIGFYLESGTPVVNAERAFNIGRFGMKLQEGDSIFVATDSMFEISEEDNLPYVREEDFIRHALDNSVENAVRSIIRYAANRKPADNISLAMLFVPSRMRRAVVTSRLTRNQRLILGGVLGILFLAILFLGGQFFVSQQQREIAEQTQQYLAEVIIRLSATPTFTPSPTPPFTPTPRPAYVNPDQVGWQFFGINSSLPPTPVVPLESVSSSEKSFVIVEGENPEQLSRSFHGASIFLIPDSELEITTVDNTFLQEHYEQVLYPPKGEFFANNHTFERSSSMVLRVPQRDDMFFHTESFCVAAKHIPPSENPQTPEEEKERIAFTCFDGVCNAQLPETAPDPELELIIGQRYLFNITDGELITSGSTIYEEIREYYDLVVELTGTDEEIECLTPYLDDDGDGFSYPDDLCESVSGPAEGCPDSDLDGVADIKDACPEEFGVANLDGCPPLLGNETPDIQETQVAVMAFGTQTSVALQATGTAVVAQGSQTAAALQGTGTSIAVQGSETAAAIQATGTAMQGSETAAALEGTQTAAVIDGSSTAEALQGTGTAAAISGSATAAALQSTQTAIAIAGTQTAQVFLGTETALALEETQAAAILQTQTANAANLVETQTAEAAAILETETAAAANAFLTETAVANALTQAASVDLVINKSVSTDADPLIAGQGDTITFTITVTNNGDADAGGVVVVDLLPDAYVYQSHSSGQTYNSGNGNWNVGTISKNGGSATLNIVAEVVGPGPYQNEAELTYDNITISDTANPNPTQQADLALTKEISNNSPNIGDTVAFTITVTNNGPDHATGITVDDLLPDGYDYVSDTPSQGTYNSASGEWDVGDIDDEANATLDIVVEVLSTGNSYENTATVSIGSPTDPNASNNSDTASPNTFADLAITKVSDVTPVAIGESITFTITVTNNGPNDATGVTVNDTLLPSYQYDFHNTATGTFDSNTGVWTVGSLTNGASATLTIDATTLVVGATNTATVQIGSGQTDPDTTNNSDSVPEATTDLAMSKSIDPTTIVIGETVAFTITVTNNGPNGATNITVSDTLPDGYSFDSATESKGSYNDGTGIWTVGNLAASESETLTIVATVLDAGTSYTNTTSVDSLDQTDNNTSNDTAEVTPDNVADLAVSKAVSPLTAVNVGETVTFTITVTNNGPGDATGIEILDVLPDGYTYDSHTAEVGTTYTTGNGQWAWGNGTVLTNGDSATLTIVATVNSSGSYDNQASITTLDQIDPDSSNDTSATVKPNTPSTDIAVTKIVDKASVTIGDTVTFTITVTNTGVDANNVFVDDVLPTGYTYTSHTAEAGTSYNSNTGIWDIGDLANGNTATLTIDADVVGASSLSDYTNTASLDTTSMYQTDSNASNNSASAAPTVTGTDLEVTKSVNPTSAAPSDAVTFTITVTNLGPNDATTIRIDDSLPGGYTYTSDVATLGSYNQGNGRWNINTTISAGSSATLTIVASVDASGDYENIASLNTSIFTDDYNSGNDSASAEITVSGNANAGALQGEELKSTLIPPSPTATATITATASITPLPTHDNDTSRDIPPTATKTRVTPTPTREGNSSSSSDDDDD